MNKKTLLPGMLLCLLALQLQAQKALKGGAPDAKLSPGLSGDGNQGSIYSPNLFNGTANVTVPIYSYGDKGISLSYNTAGVKVDELSGQIGLHWSLTAGGSITRVMKDVPDEINTTGGPHMIMGSGDVGDYSRGIKGKWARYFGGASPAGEVDNDGARYMDDESDDFTFSVGSLSFTFQIGKDRFAYTNPRTNIKIDILVNGSPATQIPLSTNNTNIDINFRVRDAQGNWYYFEKGDVSRRVYPVPGSGGSEVTLQYTSKWVISKIVQNNGQEIKYQYNEAFLYNAGSNNTDLYKSFTAFEQSGAPVPEGNIINTNNQYQSIKHIASISYPDNIKATFVYRSGSRCDDLTGGATNPVLQEIRVIQGYAGTRYLMDQAYALSTRYSQSIPMETALGSCYDVNTSGNDDYRYHRLILKGVRIGDIDGTVTEPYYTFGYKQLRLPPRFSGSQDFFGYYNGKAVSQYDGMLSIPLHTPKYGGSAAYGVDRNDDFAFAMAGILTSVKNGSGGLTEFTYGGHVLSNVTADGNITLPTDSWFLGANANDGVCLTSIKTSDPRYPGVYTQENYTYNGGQRFMPGGYFDYPLLNGTANTLFNSTFVSPHQFINGSNHGYSSVVVETKNNSGQLLSKRVMAFQNISRGAGKTSYFKIGNKNYFELPYSDKQYIKEWEIGLPLKTIDYDQNGNIVAITENTYESKTDNTSSWDKVDNIKMLAKADVSGANTTEIARDAYRPYTGISLLTKTATQKYINGTTVIYDEVTYKYDGHYNLTSTTTANSKGEKFMLKNIYNYDVGAGTLNDMTNEGLEFKVGLERWKLNASGNNDRLFDASITKYLYQNGKIRTQKLFTLLSATPVNYSDYAGAGAYNRIIAAYNNTAPVPGFQQASEVLQYDTKGNPLETKLSDQPIYKSMLWDAPTGNKVADVSNARLKDIGFTTFERSAGVSYTGSENTTDGGFTYNQSGSAGVADAISGTRVYKLIPPGGTANNKITTPVLTAGVTYMMTFWTRNFAPNISGAGLGNINYEAIRTLNSWTQWQATFTPAANGSMQFSTTQTLYIDEIRLFPKGAQMANTVYAPMAGPTSTTDTRGRITYYLYDALGRQTAVKDQDGNVISKQERHIAQ